MKVTAPMFFSPSPIQIQPYPLPPHNDNGGIVPPWLQRDLGHEATQVTVKGHEGWRVNFNK